MNRRGEMQDGQGMRISSAEQKCISVNNCNKLYTVQIYILNIMNIRYTYLIAILFIILALVSCQNLNNPAGVTPQPAYDAVEGAMVRHIYSTLIQYAGLQTTTATIDLTAPFPTGAFDDGQQINAASALVKIDGTTPGTDGSNKQLILKVREIKINSGRTAFNLTLDFNTTDFQPFSKYTKLAFNVIFIGSNFNKNAPKWSSTSTPLAGGFARNSDLLSVTDSGTAVDIAKFNFTGTNGQPSPFAYTPDATASCGFRRIGVNNYRAEIATCSKPIFFTFITGFANAMQSTSVPADISVQAILVRNSTTPNTGTSVPINVTVETDPSSPYYIFKAEEPGLYIRYTDGSDGSQAIKKLQVGMISFLLSYYDPATYPLTTNLQAYVLAAGYYGDPYSTSSAIPATAAQTSDYLTGTSLDTSTYYPDGDIGHMFCGLQRLRGDSLTLIANSLTTDQILLSTPEYTADSKQGAATCLLLATVNPICTTTQTFVPMDITKYKYTNTSSGLPIQILTPKGDGGEPALSTTANYQTYYQFWLKDVNGKNTTTILDTTYYSFPPTQTQFKLMFLFKSETTAIPANQFYVTPTVAGVTYPTITIPATAANTNYPQQLIFHVPAGTTSIPIIVNVTSDVAGTATNLLVYQKLVYYSKVLTADAQCVTSCPQKTGMTTGVDPTTTPPICIYCSDALNQNYTDGACQCKDYYYEVSASPLTCQPCAFQLCLQCTSTTCTQCVPNAYLITGGTDIHNCTCYPGFYQNGAVCSPCPVGCTACTSPTACSACATAAASTDSAGVLTRNLTTCLCIPGYYEVAANPVCLKCASTCKTCTGSPTFCTACFNDLVLNPTTGVCQCPDGKYPLDNQCALCSPICRTCLVGASYCTNCASPNAQLVRTGDPNFNFRTCQCVLPYVQFQGTCVDSTCATVTPYCSICAVQATGDKFCIACAGNRYVLNGKCVCSPAYFPVVVNGIQQCQACGTGCQVCLNKTICLTCATDATNNMNGTCSCLAGQYLTDISQGYICMACDRNCYTCSTTSTTCTSCKAGFQLNALNKCVCAGATYPSLDGTQCLPCVLNCLKCTNATTCDQCVTGLTFDKTTYQCTMTCSLGTYNAGTSCLQCPTGCTGCKSQFLCTACRAGLVLYAGACRDKCPDTTYPDLSNTALPYAICRLCPAQCKTCSTVTACSDCNPGYVLQAGQCVGTCARGTYLSAGSCKACNVSCGACLGSQNTCIQCNAPLILYNSACYSQCPVATTNGQCTSQCLANQYLSGTQCLNCDGTCRACTGSAGFCTVCVAGYAYNGRCQVTCPDGTYMGDGFCGTCDPSCKTCSTLPQNCLLCNTGYYKSGTTCVRTCSDGTYLDAAAQVCRACATGCRLCTATTCLSCVDPTLSPIGQSCQSVCPSGATQLNGKCVCNFGVMSNNICVSTCPDGFYSTYQRICQRCTSPCQTCQTSPTLCQSCVAGYTYDSANRRCTRASVCDYGLIQVSGQCVRICPSNLYYYQRGCIFQCPANTRVNQNNACIEYVNPTFCQFPLFQQGSSCVARCDNGFWPNDVTRTCDRCSPYCASCFSQTFCLGCMSGYFLNNDQTKCVASQQCPSGQYQYSSQCYVTCPPGTYASNISPICIRSCPVRTYFDNNWCYSTCRTPYYTDDACVTTCPPNTQCRPTSGF